MNAASTKNLHCFFIRIESCQLRCLSLTKKCANEYRNSALRRVEPEHHYNIQSLILLIIVKREFEPPSKPAQEAIMPESGRAAISSASFLQPLHRRAAQGPFPLEWGLKYPYDMGAIRIWDSFLPSYQSTSVEKTAMGLILAQISGPRLPNPRPIQSGRR